MVNETFSATIGILSHKTEYDRREMCLKTWVPQAKASGFGVVFLVGGLPIHTVYREGDILFLPVQDTYEALPQKTRAWCQWMVDQESPPTWGVKCDTDSYLHIPRLVSLISSLDPERRSYVGNAWRVGVDYASGACYAMSHKAYPLVAKQLTHPRGAEDLLVGNLLRENGIKLKIESRIIPFSSELRRPRPDNDIIVGHKMPPEMFMRCHSECFPVP